jgi:hypothetical protein
VPPQTQLVTIPKQMASLSGDIVDFNLVPQWCTSSRLLILRNIGTCVVEFVVDDASCAIMAESLLTIMPNYGRLAPSEHVVLDFKFTGECYLLHVYI